MTSSPDLQDVVGDVTGNKKKSSMASSRKGSNDSMYGRNGTGVQRSMGSRPEDDGKEWQAYLHIARTSSFDFFHISDDDFGPDSRKNSGAHSRKSSEVNQADGRR